MRMYTNDINEIKKAINENLVEIEKTKKEIEANRYYRDFYEPTPIYSMHDTGHSKYKICISKIAYLEFENDSLKEQIEKIQKEEEKVKAKAEKMNQTVEEYKELEDKKRKEKYAKAKYKRYLKEVESLKKELEYKMKWIEAYENADALN